MPHRVFLTGASGFVGRAITAELLSRGHTVIAVAHHTPIADARVQSVTADLFDPVSLAPALAACDAVIHLVGIIMERPADGITFQHLHVDATRSILAATQSAGIRRYLHMSALGTRPHAASTYHRTKYDAEQLVRQSGLDWTIFRPSLIHGPGGDFMQMEANWARHQSPPYLFMPYFAPGLLGQKTPAKIQPVFVTDVAKAFADALDNPHSIGEIYPLAGPDVMTWPAMHRAASRIITGQSRLTLPIPAWYATLLTKIVPPALLPFNRDQVLMSQQDNTTDITKFTQAFGRTPERFADALARYAKDL